MGLFSDDNIACPSCGHPGARRFLWRVRCRNRLCASFESSLLSEPLGEAPGGPPAGRLESAAWTTASAGPGEAALRYTNFRGERKVFIVRADTLRAKGIHLSACDAKTGTRLAFAQERVENLAEIRGLIRP